MEQAAGDLMIGLVGAAVTAFVALCWRISKSKIAHAQAIRRFPITATYLSSYTDDLDGVVRKVKDEVLIVQQALRFTGTSRNISTGRSFQIKGQIVDGRNLTGVYGGQHAADDASGVFFMKMDPQDATQINGFWAGFGSEKRQVLSGSWSWRKKLNVSIFTNQPSEAEAFEAAALLNDSLGADYVRATELIELSKGGQGILVRARDVRGSLVAAATARVLDAASVQSLATRLSAAGVFRAGLEGQMVGELKSSAVIPVARGQGVGLDLVRTRLDYLMERGCKYAVCASWSPANGQQTSRGILEAVGFEIVAVIPQYWADQQEIDNYLCSICGRDCECAATIMKRSLYDWNGTSGSGPSAHTGSSRLIRR